MDLVNVVSFIGDVGFPIAVCAYLLWHNEKQAIRHKEEVDRMSEALNNNTRVMEELVVRLTNE